MRRSQPDCKTYKSSRGESRCKWSGITTWVGYRSTDKSYPRDNRLIESKSSHRRLGLAPRCRLVASWGGSTSQGYGCSPFKAVRELGSERRETVWPLSAVIVGKLREFAPSTRGPEWTNPWCTSCFCQEHRWVATFGRDNRWKHLSGKPISRLIFPMRPLGEHEVDRLQMYA